MGVTVVQTRESSSSVPAELVDFGLKQLMVPDPKNKTTTTRWEEHVEKAFACPVAVGNFTMVAMILLYEVNINKKGIAASKTVTKKTNSSLREVSPQASLITGGMSQKK